MDEWRLIISDPLTGSMNMAIDEAMMAAVANGQSPPTIRFYEWSPPAISLGYFQKAEKEVDIDACNRLGIEVVRRPTGGRAVLHQYELTYSLVAPESNEKISGSILQSYLAISGGLVKGLAELGVEATLSEGKKQAKFSSAACFDAPSWYEMVVGGRKLIGSAQTRHGGCLLQHGSVLVRIDADLLFSILNFDNNKIRERAKSLFLAKATCLEEIMGYSPGFDQLCRCFKKGFEVGLGITLEQQHLFAEETNYAVVLSKNKYGTQEWNSRKQLIV